jgi:thiol-disulfide isomerase/thioredoxin
MIAPGRGFLLVTAILSLFALGSACPARGQSASGKAAPSPGKAVPAADPQLVDLAGYERVLAKYHGKSLVVNFWATWCEPCRFEYPMLVELAKQYVPQGVAVVGVSMDDDSDMNLVRRFLARNQPGFPNYRQKPGIDVDAFYRGVDPAWTGTMPITVFYGRDGRIVGQFVGTRTRPEFDQVFRALLAPSTP